MTRGSVDLDDSVHRVCVCVTVADACLIGVLATADAVRKNKLTQAACDADVERVVRDWLRTASDRNGGRRQRDSRVTETPRRVRPSHSAAATVKSTLPVPRAPLRRRQSAGTAANYIYMFVCTCLFTGLIV